jgi:hypothetical protein
LLIIFSYITQGMLFWGITLLIPLAVRSLGFTGIGQGLASAQPNIWSILQSSVDRRAIGAAAGVMNGLGAGGGGTMAGFLVGLLRGWTGSYMAGFGVLGALSVLGGIFLLVYGYLKPPGILPAKAAA